jgi:hypothetical protein
MRMLLIESEEDLLVLLSDLLQLVLTQLEHGVQSALPPVLLALLPVAHLSVREGVHRLILWSDAREESAVEHLFRFSV